MLSWSMATQSRLAKVSLAGDSTMEIRYDGGGTVTMYAFQQVGHPGYSVPQETLTCGETEPEPTEEPTPEPPTARYCRGVPI